MDNHAPGFVECLVPDTGGECLDLPLEAFASFSDCVCFRLQHSFSMLGLHQVHFMYQRKYMRVWREFLQRLDDVVVGVEIPRILTVATVKFSRLDVKDINQDADIVKDVGSL